MEIFIILLMIYSVIFYKIGKSKGLKKGFNEGREDAGMRITDFSYWMGKHPMIHNTLFIMGDKIKKYGTFDSGMLRKHVEEIGNTRLGDLSEEDRQEYIR